VNDPGAPLPAPARLWLGLAALFGLLSVIAGAYGRHGTLEPAGREMFAIAVQYQLAHALALLAVAWLASRGTSGWRSAVNLSGAAFALGIVLFSGTLYWFGITGLVPVEGAAPAGGYLFMVGWLALAWHGLGGGR
jgi:uncharacterized membrane protein YgdD (TMEM256/DUF423 family)